LLSGGNSGSIGDVGNDNGNLHALEATVADGLGDGDEVGAAARKQDSEADWMAFWCEFQLFPSWAKKAAESVWLNVGFRS
jgi:hypothetical protein